MLDDEDTTLAKTDNRTRKQVVEKQRRQRITNVLEELKELLQERTKVDLRKADKVEILESTLKYIKEKKQLEHNEVFSNGYNTCLVELSGILMTSTDIDYRAKAGLLSTIAKLSSKHQLHKNLSPPRSTKEQILPLQNAPLLQKEHTNKLQHQHNYHNPPPVCQSFMDIPNNINTYHNVNPHALKENRGYPPSAFGHLGAQPTPYQNTQSAVHNFHINNSHFIQSTTELPKRKRRSMENFDKNDNKKRVRRLSHGSISTNTNTSAFNPIQVPTTKGTTSANKTKTEQNIHFQVSNNNLQKNTDSQTNTQQKNEMNKVNNNTHIAIIKKNEQGQLTEISRIPLSALLTNQIPNGLRSNSTDMSQNTGNSQQMIENSTTKSKSLGQVKTLVAKINQNSQHTPVIQTPPPTPNPNTFSYVKLLQGGNGSSDMNFETVPANTNTTQQDPSLPSLSVFLGQY